MRKLEVSRSKLYAAALRDYLERREAQTSAQASGLPRNSVINVSQLFTLDPQFLSERLGLLPRRLQASVDAGLRMVLEL